MSAIRRMKKGIPKNTNCCKGCKNLSIFKVYNREEDTNGLYVYDEQYRCNLLKKNGNDEHPLDFIMSINPTIYRESDLEDIIKDVELSYNLGQGLKVCGLYLENKTNINKDKYNFVIDDIDDDIPF